MVGVLWGRMRKDAFIDICMLWAKQVAKLEQEAQRQKSIPSTQSHLERRAVRGGGGSHHAQEVTKVSMVMRYAIMKPSDRLSQSDIIRLSVIKYFNTHYQWFGHVMFFCLTPLPFSCITVLIMPYLGENLAWWCWSTLPRRSPTLGRPRV